MVIVAFKPGEKEISKYEELDQYDYGQILRIQGLNLPPAVEIHFALQKTGGTSKTRIGITKDGVTDVPIPDSMLENGDTEDDYSIYAFIYITDETSGQTEYRITLKVKARPKPEAFDRPEDAEIFKEAIKAVNESAARSAESEKQAEGWAHGREDLPERAQDNAMYYAGKTEKDAEKTATDRKEVKRLVESVSGISEQVEKVEGLTKQAQTSATNAALSEQAAKESENSAAQARAGAEVAEDNAELAAQRAEQDKAIVEQAKNLVKHMGQEVLDNKNLVDETAQDFDLKAQQALADVNNAGQAQTERVQTAGNDAVESIKAAQGTAARAVETAKTEAIEAVQTEGTTQAGNVTTEGTKQVQAVADKGKEVLQSVPEDFQIQMGTKLDKNQGAENAGKVLVVGEDGNVVPGKTQGGTVDLDTTLTKPGKAADGKATGDKILQFAIKNTVNGESPLVVPDSAEEGILGFGLTGKTEQATTKGSNLCNENAFVLGVLDASGQVSSHTNMYVSDYIPVKPSTQYVRTNLGDSSNHFYDIDKQHIINITNTLFTTPENAAYCRIMAMKKLFETNDLMFNEGTKILPYEPYTGGKPSPSPDYPQEIVNAGKWNEDTQKYEVGVKITGKNFLTDNYEQYTDGKYKQKVALPAGNYIYTCEKNNNIWILHEDGSNITNGWMATNKFNFSLAKKETIELRIETKNLAGNNHMIRLQGSDDVYVPYREPQSITLTSDRPLTKWDKLVEQDGQIGWLYQSVAKEYIGDNSVALYDTGFYFKLPDKKKVNGEGYCKELKQYVHREENPCIGFNMSVNIYTYTLNTQAIYGSTVSAIKEYLKSHPLHLVYKTETPEFVPLPQSEQDAIRALMTYYPTTVIVADGGKVDTDVEITYIADTKNYIDQKIAAIGKTVVETQKALL